MITPIFFIIAMMAGKNVAEGAEGPLFHDQKGMDSEMSTSEKKRRYILFTGIPPCCGKSSLIKELQRALSIPSTVISSDKYQKEFKKGNDKMRFNQALQDCKESLIFVDKNIPDKCGLDSVIRNLPDGDKEIILVCPDTIPDPENLMETIISRLKKRKNEIPESTNGSTLTWDLFEGKSHKEIKYGFVNNLFVNKSCKFLGFFHKIEYKKERYPHCRLVKINGFFDKNSKDIAEEVLGNIVKLEQLPVDDSSEGVSANVADEVSK